MAAATPALPLSTRLTVASLTPAWAAMSESRAVMRKDCTGHGAYCPPLPPDRPGAVLLQGLAVLAVALRGAFGRERGTIAPVKRSFGNLRDT
ncbi:hypothetical protein GCM10010275_29250 [Streptomyces litmocidini]|nr:hypothetical protein GCM10010275_29250 [Streptomyces litmocidini]